MLPIPRQRGLLHELPENSHVCKFLYLKCTRAPSGTILPRRSGECRRYMAMQACAVKSVTVCRLDAIKLIQLKQRSSSNLSSFPGWKKISEPVTSTHLHRISKY